MIDSGNPILEQVRNALDAEETHQDVLYLIEQISREMRYKYNEIMDGVE